MNKPMVLDPETEKVLQQSAQELEKLFDVDFDIDLKVGGASLTIRELIALREGDLVALDRESSSEALVTVGDVTIGHAEIILTKSGTGARITEIL